LQEEITREYFDKRQSEIMEKWKIRMSEICTSNKTPSRFYRENQCEIFEDIDELYNMAIILSIKGE
jgi:hypothetical protein